MSIDQLEAEALSLPAEQRARLAERLISSLDDDPGIEQAWVELAEDRYRKVAAGEMPTVAAEDAMRRVRRSLESP